MIRSAYYCAGLGAMTPLVALLMEGSGPVGGDVLMDRLLATLIGAALVISASAAIRRMGVS